MNKYDGNYFQTFYNEEGNPNSLSGNVIVDLFEDDQGIFWIATRDGGLTRYDPNQSLDKQFTQFKNDPANDSSIVSNRMTAITDLNADYIMISSETMMIGFVNKHDFKISYASVNDPQHSVIDPLSGKSKPDSRSWIQCFKNNGDYIYFSKLGASIIEVYNKTSKKKQIYKANAGSIRNFLVEGDSIWFTTWNQGLYIQKNPVYCKPDEFIEQIKIDGIDDEINMVASFSNQIMMAGTKTSGLYLINKQTHALEKIIHDRGNIYSIASNRINCILKDRNGIVWIGTTAGISKYNPVQWQFTAYEINNNFEKDLIHFSIFSYNDSTIGICTSNGIYESVIGKNNPELHEYIYNGVRLNPTGVISLGNHRYYLNTESGTFYFDPYSDKLKLFLPETDYNPAAKKFTTPDPFKKGSYQVYNTIFDTINQIPLQIFSTIGWGLGIYNEVENAYFDFTRGDDSVSINSNFIRVIYRDHAGNIWVGTSEGLNKWKKSIPFKNEFIRYLHADHDDRTISNNIITGIYEDENNQLWIATGNGLNKFDGNKFIHYFHSAAGSNQMYGLYADQHHNLWTAVRGGFAVFNSDSETFRFVPLPNAAWGLKNPATLYKKSNEDWFYGAGNFLIRFNPEKYYFETAFPKIYLTGFSVFDRQIFHTDAFENLRFKHGDNFITVELSCLQLSQPGTVKYKYQLAGLNEEWFETGNAEKISFTSLPPGHYALHVKVTNPQGEWSTAFQLVEFTILNPYWQQWWFFVLCGSAIICLVYAIIKFRERQLQKLYVIRNKIANDLHDDVGSALSTINLYSEVAKMKSANENEEIQVILDKISNTSIEMQETMNHIVWNLQPRNDNFDQMMLRMKSFALENLQAKNIMTEFIVDEKLSALKLEADKRNDLFLIFKEVIHNIIKYANCTTVKIHFEKINNELHLAIADNGKGFDTKDAFSGNGLHTMRERASQMKGALEIISSEGKGTLVSLRFKI